MSYRGSNNRSRSGWNNNANDSEGRQVNRNCMIRRARVAELCMQQVYTGSEKSIRQGEVILSDDTAVHGLCIPYGSLILKFSWELKNSTSKKFKGLECHDLIGYAKLDHTGSSMPLKWHDLTKRKLQSPLPNQIRRAPGTPIDVSHLYLNGFAFVFHADFQTALKEYDRLNQTHLERPAVSEFMKWARHASEDCVIACDNEAVIYAQFARVFETLFGIDFVNLQKMELVKIFEVYLKMWTIGPHALFDSFSVMDRFVARKANKTPNHGAGNDNDQSAVSGEEEDDQPKSSKYNDDGITLELTLAKAISIYKSQLALKVRNQPHTVLYDEADGVIPPEDDVDDAGNRGDDDDDDAGVADFLDLDSESGGSSSGILPTESKKRDRPSVPGDVVNSEGVVFLSTNSRKVKLLMPDMMKIPADAWVAKLVTTHLEKQYACKDMCVTHDSIFEAVMDANASYFPVELDIEIIWRVMKDMVAERKIGMYDADTHEVYLSHNAKALCDIESMPFSMHVGLYRAMRNEHETFKFLKGFLDYRYADTDHTRHMGEVLSDVDSLFNPDGTIIKMNLSDEQWNAVCLAVTSPLSVISGPGGTGKTTIIKIILRILRCAGLKGIFLFTAFKNDTINHAERSLRVLDEAENIHNDEWRSFKRKNNMFETCDTVSYRWGPDDVHKVRAEARQRYANRSNMESCESDEKVQKAQGEKESNLLGAEVVIFEESSLISMAHISGVLRALKPDTLKYIIFVGDNIQLPPLSPGEPFCNLVDALPNLSVRLVKGFRTSSQVITKNLESIRKCDLQNLCFHDPDNPDDKDGTCFIRMNPFNAIKGQKRGTDTVLKAFGDELLKLLKERDPRRERYASIQSISAYNDIAKYASCMYARYYFNDETPDDECFTHALGKNKKFQSILHKGERVVFIKTLKDKDETKKFGKGRVGYITDIFDHEKKENAILQTHLLTRVNSTAEPLHPRMKCRTIIVDGFTKVTIYGPNSFNNVLETAGCITIHRSQGAEYDEVVCLLAPGSNLCNNRVIYTAISRTKEKCHILGTDSHIEKMITTPSPVPTCAFLPMLRNKLNHARIGVFEVLASEFARTTITKLHPVVVDIHDTDSDSCKIEDISISSDDQSDVGNPALTTKTEA